MKKFIPVIIAIVLIFLIAGIAFGSQIIERYSYSQEKADLYEYFNIYNESEVPILLQDELVEEKAIIENGVYYFDLATVHAYLNTRFYWDERENLLIFTTPTQVIQTEIGTSSFAVDGAAQDEGYVLSFVRASGEANTLYVAADYVKKYTNYSYEAFENPRRMQIYTQWENRNAVTLNKDTAVRLKGGVKSPILTEKTEGEALYLLEEMETWSKVKTQDGFIGYVENKRLSDVTVETPVPVTDYVEPEYTSLTRDYKISLGWHVIGGVAGNDTLSEAVSNTKGLTTISPTWFKVNDEEGNFESFASSSYVNRAHEMGLEVWGLVDDFSYDININEILSTTSKRTRLSAGLVQAALDCGMDGINIDFETINTESGPHYVQFLRELSILCRVNNLVLSIDNYVPFNFNDYYNREEQGVVADYVIIMGYDEHWHGSGEPGSVASINYVMNGIEKMIEEVPSHKVINALPFYSIVWRTTGTEVTDEYIIMSNMDSYMQSSGLEVVWDEETCQNYGEKQDGDTLTQIWAEDNSSIEVKLNVMRNYDLGGVAVWRLGYEHAGIWDLIQAYTIE